ncbi:hypothetical protein A3F55_01595 [Candidatus Adlerbacteria bacterium RIFCSPHIGHO2_12_FULL_53_18]|uniref:Uncharacterized protein n=1 Tax=Candidatus Adlerbacteria bacterium RIFCSPHIGHO2_12_FULL_53_18 TaxID=1797242 RepID=A0A1F4XRW2_9BACT|nr:MAG: hypothetical protein A3F55_01595 [Candidatus Adlerbacteria bacterium RIFCSPHIGHO2_12_FULL_53_18]
MSEDHLLTGYSRTRVLNAAVADLTPIIFQREPKPIGFATDLLRLPKVVQNVVEMEIMHKGGTTARVYPFMFGMRHLVVVKHKESKARWLAYPAGHDIVGDEELRKLAEKQLENMSYLEISEEKNHISVIFGLLFLMVALAILMWAGGWQHFYTPLDGLVATYFTGFLMFMLGLAGAFFYYPFSIQKNKKKLQNILYPPEDLFPPGSVTHYHRTRSPT